MNRIFSFPSIVQEEQSTEIATLTEAKEDIKESRVYKHDSATLAALSIQGQCFIRR